MLWYIYALDPKPDGKNEKSEALTSKNADILDETSLHSTKEHQFILLLWNYTNDVQNNTENTLIQNFTLCRLLINGHFSNVWNEAYPHTICSGEILTKLCVCVYFSYCFLKITNFCKRWVFYLHVCMWPGVFLLPEGARRGRCVPWNWEYGCFGGALWAGAGYLVDTAGWTWVFC